VSERSFSRAAEIAWEDYYKAIEGRPVRPLFLEALPYLPNPRADERVRLAIDLGSRDGSETLALLASGWTVVAVDGAPEAIMRLRASVQAEDADRPRRLASRAASASGRRSLRWSLLRPARQLGVDAGHVVPHT
jgi:hypothetical protein